MNDTYPPVEGAKLGLFVQDTCPFFQNEICPKAEQNGTVLPNERGRINHVDILHKGADNGQIDSDALRIVNVIGDQPQGTLQVCKLRYECGARWPTHVHLLRSAHCFELTLVVALFPRQSNAPSNSSTHSSKLPANKGKSFATASAPMISHAGGARALSRLGAVQIPTRNSVQLLQLLPLESHRSTTPGSRACCPTTSRHHTIRAANSTGSCRARP